MFYMFFAVYFVVILLISFGYFDFECMVVIPFGIFLCIILIRYYI